MDQKTPQRLRALAVGLALLIAPSAAQALSMTSDVSEWTPVVYSNATPDAADDVTLTEADLVGTLAEPTFYTNFDDNGTADTSDDVIGFRVRVAGDSASPGFSQVVILGIDATGDGAMDLFVGVDNQGNPDRLVVWGPGPGLNNSPDTTSLVELQSFGETGANYDWSPVSSLDATMTGSTDPRADLDGGRSGEDHFLTFAFDYDVIGGLLGVDSSTPLSYVVGTSNQPNALNQDLGGVDGSFDGGTTYSDLGIVSEPAAPAPIPGPHASLLVACSLAALFAFRRR